MNNIKNFIKENKSNNFFFNGLKERTIEQKYQYLKNHFNYDIMNSWNRLESIANNVKIYKLGLTNEQQNRFFELCEIDGGFLDFQCGFNFIIEEFEELTKTDIFFNGRSGGYIVIVPKFDNAKSWEHLLKYYGVEDVFYFDTYKDFKEEQNHYTGSCNYSYKREIEEAYYIVKAFDKLCDILRDSLIYTLDNAEIEEHEETYTKTVKEIII